MKYVTILVSVMLMVGCAQKESLRAFSTAKVAQASKVASDNVNGAIDDKDRIYQLEKENQQYDNKEVHLLND